MEFKPYGSLDIAWAKLPSLYGFPPTVSAMVLTRGAADALAKVMGNWPDERHQRWQEALLDLVDDGPFNVWAKRVEVYHPELIQAVNVLKPYRLPTLGLVFDEAERSLMQQITEALLLPSLAQPVPLTVWAGFFSPPTAPQLSHTF